MNPDPDLALAPHTSLRVGGAAEFFQLARSGHELTLALRWAREQQVPARVIGGGSNLLVADAGVDGLIVKAANTAVEIRDDIVIAEAGVTFANLARRLAKQGFGGLEWAANVPGTVGGAAVNNAGAFGGDTASRLIALTLVDAAGCRRRLDVRELEYAYRSSVLKRRGLGDVAVESVELRVERADAVDTQTRVKEFNAQRMRSQPRIQSAGSVFANPDGDFAGRLIEAVGLKGARVGGAEISQTHANFIVNRGGATGDDVYALMRCAQDMVFARNGVWLQPEIELFGRWSDEHRHALHEPGAARRSCFDKLSMSGSADG